jgi:hypothetical protein
MVTLGSWTAQCILIQDKLTERVKTYQKMIHLAEVKYYWQQLVVTPLVAM